MKLVRKLILTIQFLNQEYQILTNDQQSRMITFKSQIKRNFQYIDTNYLYIS